MARKHDNPEARLERRLEELVLSRGGLCYKFESPGNPGVPDRIVITPDGRTIFVELKTEVGSMQRIQRWQHERMQACRADVRTLKGLEQVKAFVQEVLQG